MAQEDKQHRRSCASGKGKGRGHCGGRAGVSGMAHAALSHVHDALPSSSATGYRAYHAAEEVATEVVAGLRHTAMTIAPEMPKTGAMFSPAVRVHARRRCVADAEAAPMRSHERHAPELQCSHMSCACSSLSVHSTAPQPGTSFPMPWLSHPSHRVQVLLPCALRSLCAGAAPCSSRSTHRRSHQRSSSRG